MSGSTTLTVRLPSDIKDQLALLASRTRRTSSFLAAEAIAAYVTRELAIVEATEQSRAEIAPEVHNPLNRGSRGPRHHRCRPRQAVKRLVVWLNSVDDDYLSIIRYSRENPDAAERRTDSSGLIARSGLGRVELLSVYVPLALDKPSYMTGALVPVTGGSPIL